MAAFKTDKQLVKDYIVAHDHLQYAQLPDGTVAITMTHSNLNAKHLDLRFDLHNTILQVKERFRTHIGTPIDHQNLVLRRDGRDICPMNDNNKMLGFYSVESGMEIHIIDTDPFSLSRGGGLTDTSLVQKYRMDEEAYDKRKGTIRDYIKEQRKLDPNYKLRPKNAPAPAAPEEKGPPPGPESVEGISLNDRCEVKPGARRGVVRFIGEIPEIKAGGHWVGVQFDEPMGHNDGTVKGVRIFECLDGYGAFVRGNKILVGDYPERDLFGSDDEEGEKKAEKKDSDGEEDEDEI